MRFARRAFNRLVAAASLGVAGCGPGDESAAPNAPARAPQPGRPRFLALGDSYAIGEGVARADRWPVQLAARLRESGVDVADPQIIARTGWRTGDLDAAISRADAAVGPFALVSLQIGVNDQFQGRSVDDYRPALAKLLVRAVGFAGGNASRVLVLSIPDWGVMPYAQHGYDRAKVAAQIDEFNAVKLAEAKRAGVRYVDVTPTSRLAASRPDFIAPDGLHPSGKMYAEWVKLALPAARDALENARPAPGKPGG